MLYSPMLIAPDRLLDPYVQPVLVMRKPGDDHEQQVRFPEDDPFFSEVKQCKHIAELSLPKNYRFPTSLISSKTSKRTRKRLKF